MGKKKLLICFVVLLLVIVSSTSLVACSKIGSNININPDDPASDSSANVSQMVMRTLEALGSNEDYVSMNFEAKVKVKNGNGFDERKVYLKGNFYTGNDKDKQKNVELGFGVLDLENQGVELFLSDGRFYLNAGGTSLYLQDIDFKWLIEQIEKLGNLDNVLGTILDLAGLGKMSFSEVINLAGPLLFKVGEYNYDEKTNTENIVLKFVPDEIFNILKETLGGMDIDKTLQDAGIELPFSINDFISTFTFPFVDITLSSKIVNCTVNKDGVPQGGQLSPEGVVLKINDKVTQDDIFEMTTNSIFTKEKIDIIPENIATYVPFGLLTFQFDTVANLDATNVDAGKLVNTFVGKPILPENNLILNADLGLTMKIKSDIRLKETKHQGEDGAITTSDDSKFMIEIYSKRNPQTPMLGVYLTDSKIYVNLENLISTQSGNIKLAPKNIVVDNFNLSKWLENTINEVKATLSDIIDQVFKPENKANFKVDPATGKNLSESVVLTVSTDAETGKSFISPTIGTIIDIVKNAIGMGDFVKYDNDSIDVRFNNKFLSTLSDRFNLGLPEIADFGEAKLQVIFNEYGLDKVQITADMKNQFGLSGEIVLDDFLYGFKPSDPAEHADAIIAKAIKDKEYVTNARDFIVKSMDDIAVEVGLNAHIDKGTYNISTLLESLGYKFPGININVSEDTDLNLKLSAEMQLDEIEYPKLDSQGKPVKDDEGNIVTIKETIISRAKVVFTNTTPNCILPEKGDFITVYYFDDRYDGNAKLDLPQKGENGKKTNGTIYVDLSGFKFSNIKLPNLSFDFDLSKVIFDEINKIDFEFIFGSDSGLPSLPEIDIPDIDLGLDKKPSAQTANLTLDEKMDIAIMRAMYTGDINPELFSIKCTTEVINSILREFTDIDITLPPIDLSLSINDVDGVKISIAGLDGDKTLSADLSINKAKVGVNFVEDIALPESFDTANFGNVIDIDTADKNALIEDMIFTAMDDFNGEINLKLTMPKGTYNLAFLLNLFGVEVTDIPVKFNEDFVLDLSLIVQIQVDEVDKLDASGRVVKSGNVPLKEKVISRAYVAIRNNVPNELFKEVGDIISAYYFDDRYAENAEYVESYKYANGVVEKTHGTVYVNLSGLNIANINLSNTSIDIDLTQLIKQAISGITFGVEQQVATYAMMAEPAPAESAYIELTITQELLNEIFKQVGIEIELPELGIGVTLDEIKGIVISFVGYDGYEDENNKKEIKGEISLPRLEIGRQNDVDISRFDKNQYHTEVQDIIKELLRYGKIEAKLDLTANSTAIDLRNIINSILALSNQKFTLPINVDLNDFANTFDMLIQWELDYSSPQKSKILVELKNDSNMVLAFYVNNRNFYIDLSGLGLPKLSLTNTNLVDKIVAMIDGALNSIINSILPEESSQYALQARLAEDQGDTVAEMNNKLFAEAKGEPTTQDYIDLLLKGLLIEDGKVMLDLTNEMMAELFNMLAVNIVDDVNANVSVDIFKGLIELGVQFGEISANADLQIVSIGKKASNIELPTTDFGKYVDLNGANASLFVDSLFDALEPGIWIDMVSKNAAVTENNFKFTKLFIQRAPAGGMELQNTDGDRAPEGSIVVSLQRMDGWDPTGPDLYIILNPYASSGQLRIRATKSLLPNIVVDLSHYVNISIDLDLKTILTDAFGPILEEINKMPETKANTFAVSSSNGTSTYAVADSKEGGLDIAGLINGINVKVYDTRNIKLNVNFNHKAINELIPQVFNSLNGLSIDIGSGPITINGLVYDNKSATATFDSIWNSVIVPIVQSAAGIDINNAFVKPLVNELKGRVEDLISRILPMPEFVNFNADAFIVNGKLDNISIGGMGDGSPTDINRHRFELRIFNDMANDNVFFGKINGLDLTATEMQSPYIRFDAATDTGLENMFTQTAYVHNKNGMYYEADRDQNPAYLTKPLPVTWQVTHIDGVEQEDPITFASDNMKAFKDENGKYKPGTYTALANTSRGSMVVTVVIEDNSEFIKDTNTKVQDITVKAGAKRPNQINLVNGSKTVRTDAFEWVNADPTEIGKHTVNAIARFVVNGEQVNKNVKITYEDSEYVLADSEPYYVDIHNYKSFYNNIYNKGEIQVKTKDGRIAYVDASMSIKSGQKALYNADGTIADEQAWIDGFETVVEIAIKDAALGQGVLEKKVVVQNAQIAYARLDGKNTILLNNYHNASDIPRNAQIFFSNGRSDVMNVTWDLSSVTFGQAGSYKAKMTIASEYEGSKVELKQLEVDVIISEVAIAYAKFGASNGVRECDISYDDFNRGNFSGLNLRLVTTDGTIVEYADIYIVNEGTEAEPKPVEHANWKINTLGQTVGKDGGVVRVLVTLYNGDDANKEIHTETYLYLNVLPAVNG